MTDTDRPMARNSARDIRLDFFRGWALIAIFIGHMPMNPLYSAMPGRFGFSDAAEIFVFCSGIASAFAFARLFDRRGFAPGTARIVWRLFQLYVAHIAAFLVILAANVQFDRWDGAGSSYVDGLNLGPFLGGDTGTNVVGLLTLGYVPNYFDILPMYIVVLALVPVVLLLERFGKLAVLAFVFGCWIIAESSLADLPAEPWSDRTWFFNPFSWQLLFFLGFAFARGWLPMPPRDGRLLLAAVLVVALSVPLAWAPAVDAIGYSARFSELLSRFTDKTHLGVLRVVHFAALAYVAYMLAGEAGRRLHGWFARLLQVLGRQTLAVFLAGQFLSMLGGFLLQMGSQQWWAVVLVNAGGIATMLAVALLVGWLKTAARSTAGSVAITTGEGTVPSSR